MARKVGNASSQSLSGMDVGKKSLSIFGRFGGDVVFDPMPPVNNESKLIGGGTYLATYRTSPRSSAKNILSYSFSTPSATGTITATDSILLSVPAGTNVTGLIADFTLSPEAIAKVGNTIQVSGTTTNDFSNVLQYTVMAEDSTTKQYHVKVTILASTAIDELNNAYSTFKVWPNPASNMLHFDSETDVRLYDINGKLILTAIKAKELSINHLASGLYIIKNKEGAMQKISISRN